MPLTPPGLRWHEKADIGIVGGGGCGLVAAQAAAGSELSIVVYEKSKVAGGSTALSRGMLPGAGTRLQREAGIFEVGEDFVHDVLQRNGGRSDPVLTRRLCESSAALVEWLIDSRRLPLDLVKQLGDAGHTRFRLHAPPSGRGQTLIDGLQRSLDRRGIKLRLNTPVVQLWSAADGAVIGIQVKTPKRTPMNIRCGKVILATGGFGANADLLQQHCPAAVGLTYAGAATDSGDAVTWAADVGAALRDLDAYDAQATVAVGSNLLVPWEVVAAGAVLVNQQGQRFADEGRGAAALVAPFRAQAGHVAYEIFDARILKQVTADDPHFANEVVPRTARRADKIADLAKQFQINADALANTIAARNAVVSGGADPFGRPASAEPLASPFYGIRVTAALLQTQGGMSIDSSARVLRADGTPIPNLYAGGGAAVGLSGPGGDGYLWGNGLLSALGCGKIAGEQAAHEIIAARASAPQTEPSPAPEDEPLA